MKRVMAVLLLSATSVQAADFWSGLWLTPDQRGERLLRQGDAAAAAHTFSEPRRRAYAELLAGDYAAAARDFAGFDDSDGHYNRGNALARAGDLEAALREYDSALARDPNNRDARRNRDLVAQALRKSPPPQPAGAGSQGGSQGKPGDQAKSAVGNSSRGAQSGSQERDKGGQKQAGAKDSQPGPSSSQTDSGAHQHPRADSAEQARRDAEAGLRRDAEQHDQQAGRAGQEQALARADRNGQAPAPTSERQLARDQWLRQIPDDPGGLLRRKFMIEHLMRQQGNQR